MTPGEFLIGVCIVVLTALACWGWRSCSTSRTGSGGGDMENRRILRRAERRERRHGS